MKFLQFHYQNQILPMLPTGGQAVRGDDLGRHLLNECRTDLRALHSLVNTVAGTVTRLPGHHA